jgi:hypothetical protein
MTSFEAHRARRAATAVGAVIHAAAALGAASLVALGWFSATGGLVACALLLGVAALHVWGLTQFGTLTVTSTGIELDRRQPAMFKWEELRLVAEDRRKLVLQTPAGRLTLYPNAFAHPDALREAVLGKLQKERTA